MNSLTLVLLALSATTVFAYVIDEAQTDVLNEDADDAPDCKQRKCLKREATCVADNKCQCNDDEEGDGSLYCFPRTWYRCCIRNDPIVTNFLNETFRLPCPCSVLLTDYDNYFPSKSNYETRPNGRTCSVKVFSVGERYLGRIYVAGFQININVTYPQQGNSYNINFRGFGELRKNNEGKYRYNFNTLVQANNGNWVRYAAYNNRGRFSCDLVSNQNKRMIVRVPVCGLEVIYRPYHPKQGKSQRRIPGICVGVNPDPAVVGTLEFSTERKTLCSIPEGQTLAEYKTEMGFSSLEEAATRIALIAANQNLPFLATRCNSLAHIVEYCERTNKTQCIKAFESCKNIIDREHLVHCMSDKAQDFGNKGDAMVNYFRTCVNSICNKDRAGCNLIRNIAQNRCTYASAELSLSTETCDALS